MSSRTSLSLLLDQPHLVAEEKHQTSHPYDQTIEEISAIVSGLTRGMILINATTQKLDLFGPNEKKIDSFSISTSAKGIGQEEGSNQTPLGLHQIVEKIGDGCDPYTVFKSREKTPLIASPTDTTAYIVGRILRLKGLEEGYNEGKKKDKVVDSYQRYIYIHGTNHVQDIGKPVSQGCIRMRPEDIIKLFNQVSEGMLVYIYC